MTQTTTTNKHLASIVHAEPVKLRTGQWGVSITHADGGGHQEVVGFGDAAERAARGECIDLMARAKAERAKLTPTPQPQLAAQLDNATRLLTEGADRIVEIRTAALQALAQLERLDPGTADAIRQEFRLALTGATSCRAAETAQEEQEQQESAAPSGKYALEAKINEHLASLPADKRPEASTRRRIQSVAWQARGFQATTSDGCAESITVDEAKSFLSITA